MIVQKSGTETSLFKEANDEQYVSEREILEEGRLPTKMNNLLSAGQSRAGMHSG